MANSGRSQRKSGRPETELVKAGPKLAGRDPDLADSDLDLVETIPTARIRHAFERSWPICVRNHPHMQSKVVVGRSRH